MMLMCIVAQYLIIKLKQVLLAPRFIQPNAHLTLQLVETSWGLESYIAVNNAFLPVKIKFQSSPGIYMKIHLSSPQQCLSKASSTLCITETPKDHIVTHVRSQLKTNPCVAYISKTFSLVFLAWIMKPVFCEQYEMIYSHCARFL